MTDQEHQEQHLQKLSGNLGPVHLEIRGRQSIIIALLSLTLVGVLFLLWHVIELQAKQTQMIEEMIDQHMANTEKEHEHMKGGMQGLIWMEAQSEETKRKLNLTEPDFIRAMRRDRVN